jgi:hypothetical protein
MDGAALGVAEHADVEDGAEMTWKGITHRQLIRFEPPLIARASPGAVPVAGYLELPRGAPLEISHLQMNQDKHLCYWGTHRAAGPAGAPSAPGWISAGDIVFQ